MIKFIILALTISTSSFAVDRAQVRNTSGSKCFFAYEAASKTNPDIAAAFGYLKDASDDFDWESIDLMVSKVRKALDLGAWKNTAFEDVLNVAVVHALRNPITSPQSATEPYCQGKPWTIQRLTVWTTENIAQKLESNSEFRKAVSGN